MTDRRRLLRVPLVLAAIAGSSCSAPEPPDRPPASEVDARRERLRDHLRLRLGDAYDEPLPASTAEEIAQGSKIYDLLCRGCHGPTGRGNGSAARLLPIRPPDLADPRTTAFFSDRAKATILAEGIAGTPMIGWSDILGEQERIAVLQFMNTLIREPRSP
jgi:mono/diheme cytochrome c family protein